MTLCCARAARMPSTPWLPSAVLIRNLLGEKWAPLEVHFEHAGPGADHRAARAYAQAFHAPVFFGQNLNRLVIRQAICAVRASLPIVR